MYLSIVIPLFNKEKTVKNAIQSVLRQSHQDYEIIVVNDGSTDAGVEEVETINDNRIKLIHQTNMGASAARNEGVRQSSYDWVAFLDADDEYFHTFLEEIAEFIEEHNTRHISFVSSNYVNGSTGPAFLNVNSGIHNYFKLCTHEQTPAHSSSTIVRKKDFFLAGGFPEGIKQFEDWNLWCKLAWLGEFGFVAEPLSYYHISNVGTASTIVRSGIDYYGDVIMLPRTIREWVLDGRIKNNIVRESWIYVNHFILGQSRVLLGRKEKILAWRLLQKVDIKYYDRNLVLITLMTFIFLLLPNGGRNVARKLFRRYCKKFYADTMEVSSNAASKHC